MRRSRVSCRPPALLPPLASGRRLHLLTLLLRENRRRLARSDERNASGNVRGAPFAAFIPLDQPDRAPATATATSACTNTTASGTAHEAREAESHRGDGQPPSIQERSSTDDERFCLTPTCCSLSRICLTTPSPFRAQRSFRGERARCRRNICQSRWHGLVLYCMLNADSYTSMVEFFTVIYSKVPVYPAV